MLYICFICPINIESFCMLIFCICFCSSPVCVFIRCENSSGFSFWVDS